MQYVRYGTARTNHGLEDKMEKMSATSTTKRERFVRIAERRVNQVLDGLESLEKCSNRHNYAYEESDVKKIFGELEKRLREVRQSFSAAEESRSRFTLAK